MVTKNLNSFIVQWNCNGFFKHYDYFKLLLTEENPTCFCLQETHFLETQAIDIKNYTIYRRDRTGHKSAWGGVAIMVKSDTHSEQIKIQSSLEVVAAKIYKPEPIIVCNIYIPPNRDFTAKDIQAITEQLSRPVILVGDFNGHSKLWGSTLSDYRNRGREIESFIDTNNSLVLMNDGSPTHLSAKGTFSAIDLSFVDVKLHHKLHWTVKDILYGSDHFPISIKFDCQTNVTLKKVPMWSFKTAKWGKFSSQIEDTIKMKENAVCNLEECISLLNQIILDSAKKSIAHKIVFNNRCLVPWWNEDCEIAIKNKKRALNKYKKTKRAEDLEIFKKMRSIANKTLRANKKQSWENYVNSINCNSTIKDVWKKINAIQGTKKRDFVSTLDTGSKIIIDPQEISEILGTYFLSMSKTNNYTINFQEHKHEKEKNIIELNTDGNGIYNELFTMDEMENTLKMCKDLSSAGPDNIPYIFLKNLPSSAKSFLLSIYNRIWTTGIFPKVWKKATVVPIKKKPKDININNHRPISLLCCMSKLLEKMVNNRLIHYLETNNFFSTSQGGFRKNRSTIDQIIKFENEIQAAFANQEHLIAIFIDIEKAYDTLWRYNVVSTLSQFGLKGRVLTFINNFLNERTFQVKVGHNLSQEFQQENGTPQGSPLSVTLFLIAINGIARTIPADVHCSLFADDFAVYTRNKSLDYIEWRLKTSLENLEAWSETIGFSFSSKKTRAVHYCRKKKCQTSPTLYLFNQPIVYVDTIKFLGVYFDKKLNWADHIRYVKSKCQKGLNLLKVLASTQWGSDRRTLLMLYRTLIRPIIDYGAVAYSSASASTLKLLDPVHNQGLRLCTGLFRTTPVGSLYAESAEPSLKNRRTYLSLVYFGIAMSRENAIEHKPEANSRGTILEHKSSCQCFHNRCKKMLEQLEITPPKFFIIPAKSIPYWNNNEIVIDNSLAEFSKPTTPPPVFRKTYKEREEFYSNFCFWFTDASKTTSEVGCAVVMGSSRHEFLLTEINSVYTGELYAIWKALTLIAKNDHKFHLIVSDSLSSLKSLKKLNSKNVLVTKIQLAVKGCKDNGKTIIFLWVPSHQGIEGNEEADQAANEARIYRTAETSLVDKTTTLDWKKYVKQRIDVTWFAEWKKTGEKLATIKNCLDVCNTANRKIRREEVILARLRTGHTAITHTYLLKGLYPPTCRTCKAPLTVEHILLHCEAFREERQICGIAGELDIALGDTERTVGQVFKYLKICGLYHLI